MWVHPEGYWSVACVRWPESHIQYAFELLNCIITTIQGFPSSLYFFISTLTVVKDAWSPYMLWILRCSRGSTRHEAEWLLGRRADGYATRSQRGIAVRIYVRMSNAALVRRTESLLGVAQRTKTNHTHTNVSSTNIYDIRTEHTEHQGVLEGLPGGPQQN